jgi:hypothetical protein
MLGVDKLPIDQSMRLDVVFGLKLALDEQRAKAFRGESADRSVTMSSCVLLYSCFGQLIKDQPHLFVFEPHGLDRPIGFNWLRIHQGIEDFGLAVRRDRPITVEGRHGAGVAKILAVGLPLFRRPAYFLAEHRQGVPKTMWIVIGEPRPFECLLENPADGTGVPPVLSVQPHSSEMAIGT